MHLAVINYIMADKLESSHFLCVAGLLDLNVLNATKWQHFHRPINGPDSEPGFEGYVL